MDISKQVLTKPNVSRRGALGRLVALSTTLLGIAGITVFGLKELKKAENPLKGKKLVRKEGELVEATENDQPVVKIKFTAIDNEKKIPIRRTTSLGDEPQMVLPEDIKTSFAVRVFGDGYPSGITDAGRVTVKDKNGNKYIGGLWFQLTDIYGQAVDWEGKPVVGSNEKPYGLAAGNFVTVTKTEQEVGELQKNLLPQAR